MFHQRPLNRQRGSGSAIAGLPIAGRGHAAKTAAAMAAASSSVGFEVITGSLIGLRRTI